MIAEMAEWIKANHPQGAGIVYTYSRKDADTVANALCNCGVVAEVRSNSNHTLQYDSLGVLFLSYVFFPRQAYHSDVSTTLKESIHKSWMRNETQVVVATIAFGLGYVAFAFVTSVFLLISHRFFAFVRLVSTNQMFDLFCIIPFQKHWRLTTRRVAELVETAILRNAFCITVQRYARSLRITLTVLATLTLFCNSLFLPLSQDVIRLLKMVHGTSSEHLLWPMIRYAQESGNDPVCKAIILKHLGEPNAPDVSEVVTQNEDIVTTRRDVGAHAKTVVQLVQQQLQDGKDVTMAMLVKEWRLTGPSALPWYVNSCCLCIYKAISQWLR